jgi:hypothetical protein
MASDQRNWQPLSGRPWKRFAWAMKIGAPIFG